MKLHEITAVLERFAPLALQEDYDNAGLITGSPGMEVTGAVLCLDVTEAVLDEAVARGANLVISHHPILFRPLKTITGQNYVERIVIRAIRDGIALYAAHTNLDSASRGTSYLLAEQLGLEQVEVLEPRAEVDREAGFGAVGNLPAPVDAGEFLRAVKEQFGVGCVRHSLPPKSQVQRIALCTGSGGSLLDRAIRSGADVYLTADVKYDLFFAAEGRILLADIGHFESEIGVISLLYELLRKKFPTFALHKSEKVHNPVNYL